MKAFKDCEWEVKIEAYSCEPCYYIWETDFPYKCGAKGGEGLSSSDVEIQSNRKFRSWKEADKHWRHFAKINGIKKWRYISNG